MATPKFGPGDRVMVRATRENPSVRAGVYRIIRSLPEGHEGRQYRVKNVMDEHERVLHEADIALA